MQQTPNERGVELPSIEVVSLSQRAEWLPLIAQWHQEQWPADNYSHRVEKLRLHLGPEPIPTTLILVCQGRPAGSISLVRYQRLGGLAPSYWVANVFVLAELRGQGLGRHLLSAVEDYACRQGISDLYLYATDFSRYYSRLGWRSVRHRRLKGQPVTIMHRVLDTLPAATADK